MATERIIKVNQIATSDQALRLRKRIDIGGICIARDAAVAAPYLGTAAALELRKAVPDLPLAVSFRRDDAFTDAEIAHWLDALAAAYYEFTPYDPLKKSEFDAQLARLAVVSRPKLANSFFVLKDDTRFIEDMAPLDSLHKAGVALFQFEIESGVDANSRLTRNDLARADACFARFPTLIADTKPVLASYPLPSIAGFFFNVAGRDAMNYDYSRTRHSESEITRLLMQKGKLTGHP